MPVFGLDGVVLEVGPYAALEDVGDEFCDGGVVQESWVALEYLDQFIDEAEYGLPVGPEREWSGCKTRERDID